MRANPKSADEENGSFGPARRELHEQRPGHEPVEQKQDAAEEDRHKRRSRSGEAPRTGLTERIHRRQEEE